MFDSPDDARPRDKFPPRERVGFGKPRDREDFVDNRNRRDYQPNGFANGGFNKRPFRRDDDQQGGAAKKQRFDNASDTFDPQFIAKEDSEGVQPLMTFRKFLMTQEDGLTDDSEAVRKYNEYKSEYQKNTVQRFFKAHRDEDWFVKRYFPENHEQRLAEKKEAIEKRLSVFNELLDSGELDVPLDYSKSENILHLLDIAVVKLEGGSDEDVEAARNETLADEAIVELKKLVGKNGDAKQANGGAKDNVIHKTSSISFQNVPPSVSAEDLEKVCKQHPGFLRLGFSEPAPENKFVRRAWATFKRNVNVREIFWSLKGVKLGDADLGAAVAREPRRRIRWVNGLTKHRTVTQNDLKIAAKLVIVMDYKHEMFQVKDEEGEVEAPSDLEIAISKSKNPVLSGITDYLIDEVDVEEDALLGNDRKLEDKQPLELDEEMLKALDKIVYYLRMVYSFDFYGHIMYANEDALPNRLSIFHIRGPLSNEHTSSDIAISQTEAQSYIQEFSEQFDKLLKLEILTEDDLMKLGKKDPDQAVEDFIQVNTVELGKDKWLCPLSGKKFKGPEFIQKHLASKHKDRLDLERNYAVALNNYLSDIDRVVEAEAKAPVVAGPSASQTQNDNSHHHESRPRERFMMTERSFPRFGGGGGFGNSGGFGRGGGGRFFGGQTRQQPSYRDLDAPEE